MRKTFCHRCVLLLKTFALLCIASFLVRQQRFTILSKQSHKFATTDQELFCFYTFCTHSTHTCILRIDCQFKTSFSCPFYLYGKTKLCGIAFVWRAISCCTCVLFLYMFYSHFLGTSPSYGLAYGQINRQLELVLF